MKMILRFQWIRAASHESETDSRRSQMRRLQSRENHRRGQLIDHPTLKIHKETIHKMRAHIIQQEQQCRTRTRGQGLEESMKRIPAISLRILTCQMSNWVKVTIQRRIM